VIFDPNGIGRAVHENGKGCRKKKQQRLII
jgi:hypothetical protein